MRRYFTVKNYYKGLSDIFFLFSKSISSILLLLKELHTDSLVQKTNLNQLFIFFVNVCSPLLKLHLVYIRKEKRGEGSFKAVSIRYFFKPSPQIRVIYFSEFAQHYVGKRDQLFLKKDGKNSGSEKITKKLGEGVLRSCVH